MTVLKRYTVPAADGGVKYMRYVSRVEWRNIGLFWFWALKEFGVSTPWGNIIASRFKPFECRYGDTPHIDIFGLCVRWVRLKTMEEDPSPYELVQ